MREVQDTVTILLSIAIIGYKKSTRYLTPIIPMSTTSLDHYPRNSKSACKAQRGQNGNTWRQVRTRSHPSRLTVSCCQSLLNERSSRSAERGIQPAGLAAAAVTSHGRYWGHINL